MSSSPPDGFTARPLEPGDARAAAALLLDYDGAHFGEVIDRLNEQDVLDWWGFYDLERDSMALHGPTALAAFGLLNVRADDVLELDGYVHPERCGRGLGTFLLEWAEATAHGSSRRLRVATAPADAASAPLVEERGYRPVRHFYRMVVDLPEPPPTVEWPAGFDVSILHEGEERLLHEAIEEAFADEWGRPSRSLADWQQTVFTQEAFDPSLCFLVRCEDEVVAAEMCSRRFGMGFVNSIGVRKPWRRRGLGRALLLHGFSELFERGERRVGLGVDAENPTGATHLYESVGMRVAWHATVYEESA
jgi:mycothiol synthase